MSSLQKTDPGLLNIIGSSDVANRSIDPQGLQHAAWTWPDITVQRSGNHWSVFHTLNMILVVAAITLDPSGDHVTSDTPPPPTRRRSTNFSKATSHTYMAVSAAEAVRRISP
ncbi:hypothetical protein C0J52_05273 [Blattella germanica]|nr:hypothetical protein C0J52_05273 [Blattella germanica]